LHRQVNLLPDEPAGQEAVDHIRLHHKDKGR
jgi:hypothetical protein